MNQDRERIHRFLDGEDQAPPDTTDAAHGELEEYRHAMELLEQANVSPPEDFVEHVMSALPDRVDVPLRKRILGLWPREGKWLAPLAVGAAASLLAAIGVLQLTPNGSDGRLRVTFELHAPGTESVELIGSFNNWTPGDINLRGPDATGHWDVTIPLPEGRHEYQFLIDGRRLITDPKALLQRPDGFGRMNAVLDI